MQEVKLHTLEGDVEIHLHDLGFSNGFLDLTPKPKQQQPNIDTLDCPEIKNISASKESEKTAQKTAENSLRVLCLERVC